MLLDAFPTRPPMPYHPVMFPEAWQLSIVPEPVPPVSPPSQPCPLISTSALDLVMLPLLVPEIPPTIVVPAMVPSAYESEIIPLFLPARPPNRS